MKKQKLFYGIFLIIGCLFALASCDWFTEEEDGEDRIDVKGQRTVYVGSTIRPFYSLTAPSYADFDYATIRIGSSNEKIGDAYFTESCADDDEGWSEFVVEGKKKGTFKVKLWVEEFDLSTSVEFTVVDADSLKFKESEVALDLESNTTKTLAVENNQKVPVVFSSSDESIVTVSQNGTITAKKSGVAAIIVQSEDEVLSSTCVVTVKTGKPADQFFWGEWISGFDGSRLVIKEKNVTGYEYDDTDKENPVELEVEASSPAGDTVKWIKIKGLDELVAGAENVGKFTKSTDNVMIYDYDDTQENGRNIPYFRNGGQNLTYTLQLVGFTKETKDASRAVSSMNLKGLTVNSQSQTYTSYTEEAKSDDNGKVTLTAPVAGDVQTIKITSEEGSVILIPDLKIETNGSSMGKIPVTGKGEYSLKVTGEVDEDQLYDDDGYMYQGKSYKMNIVVTNVSEVKSGAGSIIISSKDSNLTVDTGVSSEEITITTLKPGATKKIPVTISYSGLTKPYIDTEINVTIKNAKTSVSPEREWEDVVPVRIFQKQVPVTFKALAAEGTSSKAKLHGFIIYPDNSNLYFDLESNQEGTLQAPSFGDEPYKIVFCGASAATSEFDDSTMHYTVALGTETAMEVNPNPGAAAMGFGEGNDSEDNPYTITDSSFQAYLDDGDIDFWQVYIR